MRITDKAVNAIKGNNRAMNALGYAFNKGYKTIENWLKSKDIRLTTPTAVDIIKAETQLAEEEILEVENALA